MRAVFLPAALVVFAAVSFLLRPSPVRVVDVPDMVVLPGSGLLLGAGFGLFERVSTPLPVLRPGPHVLVAHGLPVWSVLDVGGWGGYVGPWLPAGLLVGLLLGAALLLPGPRRAVAVLVLLLAGLALGSPALPLLALPLLSFRVGRSRRRLLLVLPAVAVGSWAWGPVGWSLLVAALAGLAVVWPPSGGRAGRVLPALQVAALSAALLSGSALLSGPPRVAPGELFACLEAAGGDDPEERRCAEGLLWFLGLERPYEVGRGELVVALRAAEQAGFWTGRACRVGEEALSEAAFLRDPSSVSSGLATLCDFSLQHGIGSAASFFAEDPVSATSEICAGVSFAGVEAPMAVSQCWHGAGQGLARRAAYDLAQVAAFCREAPSGDAVNNCFEGANMSALTVGLGRGTTLMPLPEEFCRDAPEELLFGCYRYLVLHRVQAEGLGPASDALASVCEGLPEGPGRVACWKSVGLTVASVVMDAPSEVPARAAFCERAQDRDLALECLLLFFEVSIDERRGVGFEWFEWLLRTPEEREWVLGGLERLGRVYAGRTTVG